MKPTFGTTGMKRAGLPADLRGRPASNLRLWPLVAGCFSPEVVNFANLASN